MVPVGTVFTPDQPGNATSDVMVFVWAIITVFFIMLAYVAQKRSVTQSLLCLAIALGFAVLTGHYITVSSSGGPSVEGVVSRVASTPDGPVVVFDDGKSVLASGHIDELKDLADLRVRFSCDSKGTKADNFDSISWCEYDKIVSGPSSRRNSN